MTAEEERNRLAGVRRLIKKQFSRFGPNKHREIVRLVYEISKRDRTSPDKVIPSAEKYSFPVLKQILLERRYPSASAEGEPVRPYLPDFDLEKNVREADTAAKFSPRRIFVEEAAAESDCAERFRKFFPAARITPIDSLKEYLRSRSQTKYDYSSRGERVFLIGEKHDFYKPCPCTRRSVPCGYHIFNLAFGCIYECAYCYLQEYSNAPGLIFPVNLERYFSRFRQYYNSPEARRWRRGKRLRIGTGEFSDSLMLDHITGYAPLLIDFFKELKDVLFEFKTKSDNIGNLLKRPSPGNIVAAWSLNPPRVIEATEFLSAPLNRRLAAARSCAGAGYLTAFHFDPIFYYPGWKEDYRAVIESLFEHISPQNIAWISLGTFRFTPRLKKIIEVRFPDNTILDAELLPGFDGKLRYPDSVRYNVYKFMLNELREKGGELPVYLCMENASMWKELELNFPFTESTD